MLVHISIFDIFLVATIVHRIIKVVHRCQLSPIIIWIMHFTEGLLRVIIHSVTNILRTIANRDPVLHHGRDQLGDHGGIVGGRRLRLMMLLMLLSIILLH